MKFKYSVIGDNTAENREWLEKIGYKQHPDYNKNDRYIVAYTADEIQEPYYDTSYNLSWNTLPTDINCIGSDNLFRAISAMRDDSDFMQWFTNGDDFELCRGIDFLMEDLTKGDLKERKIFWHKATIEELQECFKK